VSVLYHLRRFGHLHQFDFLQHRRADMRRIQLLPWWSDMRGNADVSNADLSGSADVSGLLYLSGLQYLRGVRDLRQRSDLQIGDFTGCSDLRRHADVPSGADLRTDANHLCRLRDMRRHGQLRWVPHVRSGGSHLRHSADLLLDEHVPVDADMR